MKAVLKIAHRAFLFPSAAHAAKAIALLGECMELQSKHVKVGSGNDWRYIEAFFPDSNPSSLSMEMVTEEQLRAIEPKTDEEHFEVPGTPKDVVIVVKPRHHAKRLLLTGGAR